MVIVQEKFRHWPAVNQLLMIVAVFMVFHLPNTILRFNGLNVIVGQLVLLGFFAIGQSLLFWRTRNLYALTLSHAIWGMVLLVHAW
jgi:membrane protease YdiL (CAAX protease family)